MQLLHVGARGAPDGGGRGPIRRVHRLAPALLKRPPVTRIQREDFVRTLAQRGGYIDTRQMSPELTRAFADAGVTTADLRELAGQDHVIRGGDELRALFARIDRRADDDGSSLTMNGGEAASLTRAGRLYEALRTHVDANRTRAASEGGLRFDGVRQLDEVAAGTRTLGLGSSGEAVRRVQQALVDMGYANPELMTMGTYDAETVRAVRRFQRDAGVGVDGGIGADTLGALRSSAPRPGQVLETSPEYRRLYADGRLDVTIALGFDEDHTLDDGTVIPGAHQQAERDVMQGLRDRGFRPVTTDEIRRMSADDRRRLGLDDARLDPNARYFVRDDGRGRTDDVVVRLITPSAGGATARASFERAMQQDEMVIYSGHARYGTGPDFDHKTNSGAGNFVIDGRGNRTHDPAPQSLRSTIGASTRSDLRGLASRPDYQLLVFNACSTEEYLHNLRNPTVFGRDMANTDIITTTIPTRIATNVDHTFGFLDGVLARQSTNQIVNGQSQVEVDFLNAHGMTDEARDARMTYSVSGFLGNEGTRSRAP